MADHAPEQAQTEDDYHPKDALGAAVKATAVTGAAGLFISTVQNTLYRHNVGAFGAFSRFGGTTAVYGALAGGYWAKRYAGEC